MIFMTLSFKHYILYIYVIYYMNNNYDKYDN